MKLPGTLKYHIEIKHHTMMKVGAVKFIHTDEPRHTISKTLRKLIKTINYLRKNNMYVIVSLPSGFVARNQISYPRERPT